MPPVVVSERSVESDAERSVHLFPLGLPPWVGRTLHAHAVEVVAQGDPQVEAPRVVVSGERGSKRLLRIGARSEIAEGDDAHGLVDWCSRERRRWRADERRKHRAALQADPAFLGVEKRVERPGPAALRLRGDTLVQQCIEVAHSPAAQRFQCRQRNGRIGIRCDNGFNERCVLWQRHPTSVSHNRLGDRRSHPRRRVLHQLRLHEGVDGGNPSQQSNERLTQHLLGYREKPLLLARRRPNVTGDGGAPVPRQTRQNRVRQDDGTRHDSSSLGRGAPGGVREKQRGRKNEQPEPVHQYP